jgi:two-component system response regulator NreC
MQFPYLPIRLVIVDHHEIFREGLKTSIEKIAKGKIEIVAEIESSNQLQAITNKLNPDIILTDIHAPVYEYLLHIKQVLEKSSNLGIIVLTHMNETKLIYETLEVGVKGYLLKNASAQMIAEAIVTVKRGQTYYCKEAVQTMVRLIKPRHADFVQKCDQHKLTEKEVMIIRMICKQLTTKEIAHHLQISRRTVEDCSKRIKEKMGAKSIVGIVLHAVKNKIFTINEMESAS